MDYYTQRDIVDEHFKNFYFLNDPDALITYDQISVINFCMNPHNALSGDVMGGQLIQANQSELEITTTTQAGDTMVHMFMYRYNLVTIDRNGNA